MPWAGSVAGPRTTVQYRLMPCPTVSMKWGERALSAVLVTRIVSREPSAGLARCKPVTCIRSGGVPVTARAALTRAGDSTSRATAIRAGRERGRTPGCHAPANSDAGAVTAAASHSGVIIR